jgi:hypothetical protein
MRLTIKLSAQDAALIDEFLEYAKSSTFNSHGPLDRNRLAQMLLEDVALAMRRPGSWEGANMLQLLRSHGYVN